MLRKIGKIRGKGLGLRVADDEEENYRFYNIWWLEVNQCDYCPLRGQLGKCSIFRCTCFLYSRLLPASRTAQKMQAFSS